MAGRRSDIRTNNLPRGGLDWPAWKRLQPVEKLQVLYGLALDRAYEALSWSGPDLNDPNRLAAQTSCRHDILLLATKWSIELHRDAEREKALKQLSEQFGTKG